MGRALRIGLYSPYFGSALGGGEKYLGVAAEALRDAFPQHAVDIVSPQTIDRERYESGLNLDLSGIGLVAGNRRVTPFHKLAARARFLRALRNRVVSDQSVGWSRGYDLWLAMAYVIPVRSEARLSLVLCQFPYPLDSERIRQGLEDFEAVICQSEYVRGWTRRRWQRDAAVLNPPIDQPVREPDYAAKRRVILSVGRFVAGGHNKRHDLLAQAFRDLVDGGLKGWELHLAGSVHHDRASLEYLDRVRTLARGYPVRVHEDLPFRELEQLYREASIYWHAAGFGVEEMQDPEALEHFGMATAEAMGYGAVPVVIARGGQLEVVRDGVDGRLWHDVEDLKRITADLITDEPARSRLAVAAHNASKRWSRDAFRRRLVELLTPYVRRLEDPA